MRLPLRDRMKAALTLLRKVYPHPTSEYAPIMGTVHHKNPISAPSPLLRRGFEGAGSGATAFQRSNIDGKAEERLVLRERIDG